MVKPRARTSLIQDGSLAVPRIEPGTFRSLESEDDVSSPISHSHETMKNGFMVNMSLT